MNVQVCDLFSCVYNDISFYLKRYFKLVKKQIFSNEKMKNSGNFIYDSAHSFFREDF